MSAVREDWDDPTPSEARAYESGFARGLTVGLVVAACVGVIAVMALMGCC